MKLELDLDYDILRRIKRRLISCSRATMVASHAMEDMVTLDPTIIGEIKNRESGTPKEIETMLNLIETRYVLAFKCKCLLQ